MDVRNRFPGELTNAWSRQRRTDGDGWIGGMSDGRLLAGLFGGQSNDNDAVDIVFTCQMSGLSC